MEPFERSLSKLSENQKIVEIGFMILKLWQLKNVQIHTMAYLEVVRSFCKVFGQVSNDRVKDASSHHTLIGYGFLLLEQILETHNVLQIRHKPGGGGIMVTS